jgi:uncharacterized protein
VSAPAPRYGTLPLPPYRHRPGTTPHPRRDPAGHSYGRTESPHPPWRPEYWRTLEAWLHGVDLFNDGYYWECHEALEALWIAGGRTSRHARFVRGVILISAALLNRELEKSGGGKRQAALGIRHLESVLPDHPAYMGLEVAPFAAAVAACFRGSAEPPTILLSPILDA